MGSTAKSRGKEGGHPTSFQRVKCWEQQFTPAQWQRVKKRDVWAAPASGEPAKPRPVRGRNHVSSVEVPGRALATVVH